MVLAALKGEKTLSELALLRGVALRRDKRTITG